MGNSQKIKLWKNFNQESKSSKNTKTLKKESEDRKWKPPMLLYENSYTRKSKDTDSMETLSNSNDILQKN